MARVERRVAKAQQQGFAPTPNTAAATPATNATNTNTRPAQPSSANRTVNASKTNTNPAKSAISSDPSFTATAKSSYVPPVVPKLANSVSESSAPRVQSGTSTTRSVVSSNQTPRPNIAAAASSSSSSSTLLSPSSSISSSATASASAASSFVNPADDDTRSGAPGSLLDGDFDEHANKQWFEAARAEWIASTEGDATSSTHAASKVQLVHDPDYTPAVEASPSPNNVTGGGSLLDGPAFNERESAKEFAEARLAWIASLSTSTEPKTSRLTRPHDSSTSSDVDDGMWNPSIALGHGGSILFPTEEHANSGSNTSRNSTVSAALRAQQSGMEKTAKASCYQCYKLFYTTVAYPSIYFPGRPFCSAECRTANESSTKMRCSATGCSRSFLPADAIKIEGKDGQFFCQTCGENNGEYVPRVVTASRPATAMPHQPGQTMSSEPSPTSSSSAAAAASHADSLASSFDSIPHASSPELEEDRPHTARSRLDSHDHEREHEDDIAAEESEEIPAPHSPLQVTRTASRIGSAATSRPTTASTYHLTNIASSDSAPAPIVLDTSVIRQATTKAPAAAAVVEFPSDDDEE